MVESKDEDKESSGSGSGSDKNKETSPVSSGEPVTTSESSEPVEVAVTHFHSSTLLHFTIPFNSICSAFIPLYFKYISCPILSYSNLTLPDASLIV